MGWGSGDPVSPVWPGADDRGYQTLISAGNDDGEIGLLPREAVDPAHPLRPPTAATDATTHATTHATSLDSTTIETPPASAETAPAALARLRARLLLPPLLLAACVFAVHDVGYMLRQTYWVDESWVAVSTKYPFRQLPDVTSTSPIGWSALVRLFSFGGQQSARMLTLAFAAAAVAVAYAFGKNLGWRDDRVRLGAGLLAAIGVLMVPAMLERNDLKQYTADACLALAALALTSRLERVWSRGGLAALAATVGGGMLFSHTVAFVGGAAFASIAIVQLVRREWRRLLEVVVAGAVTLAVMAGVYAKFDARAITPRLTAYWHFTYLPVSDGAGASWHLFYLRLGNLRANFGLGPAWLALPLVLAGLITLFRIGRPMTACAILLLAPVLVTLSAMKKYPLLDGRTSVFLMVIVVVVAATGVVGLCVLLMRWSGRAALGVAVAATAVFLAGAIHDVRGHTIGHENIREQANFVAVHRAPDDVILVNMMSSWGFGYYWNYGPLARRPSENVDTRFLTTFPTQPQIIIASGRKLKEIRAALQRALTTAKRTNAAHIWIVKTHITIGEQQAWEIAFEKLRIEAVAPGPTDLLEINVR